MKIKILPAVLMILSLLFFVLSVNYFFLIIVGIMAVAFVFYQWHFYYKYVLFVFLILLIFLVWWITLKPPYFAINQFNPSKMTLKIVSKHSSYYVVKYQNYYFSLASYNFLVSLNIDDYVVITGNVTSSHNFISNFNEYNAVWDKYGKNISGQIKLLIPGYEHLVGTTVRSYIYRFMQNYDKSNLLSAFFLQIYSAEFNELFNAWSQLNVGHLLVISGFHINLQVVLLNFLLLKFIKWQVMRDLLIFCWLLFYVYLLAWQISAMRAFLFWLVVKINYYKKSQFHKLDLWAIVCLLFVIKNLVVVFQTSFQFSFFISLIIIFGQIYSFKYRLIWRYLCIQILVSIFIVPINIYFQGYVNVFIIFHQIIFGFLMQIFYYLFFIFIWIAPLRFMPYYAYYGLVILSNVFLKLTVFYNLAKLSEWFYLFYYAILLLVLTINFNNYWKIIMGKLYFNLWFYWIMLPFFNPAFTVHMLNVGNALSIFIKLPYNQGNFLYDAGIESFKENNSLIFNYLRFQGVNFLDAVFISHNHSDHYNNLLYLQNNLQINKIYTNKEHQQQYKFKDIIFYNWAFNYQHYIATKNENNRSLVLFWTYQNYKFLLTGDIESAAEKEIIKYVNILKINYFQVPHHGSNTSSTMPFLTRINPVHCFVANNANSKNRFHAQTRLRLNAVNCHIYQTAKYGTIVYKINNYHESLLMLNT